MKKLSLLLFGLLFLLFACSEKDSPQDNNTKDEEPVADEISWSGNTQYNTYINNGLINNAADPGVFRDDDGVYYLYHTGKGFKVYSSLDLVNWTYIGKVMPNYAWADEGFWAPEVFKKDNLYYLTYTAKVSGLNMEIGLAVSSSPEGPFVDLANHSFHKNANGYAIIDSHFLFDDDGKVYLYYDGTIDPNAAKISRQIRVIEVKSDLSGTIGEPVGLAQPEQEWEFSPTADQYWNEGTWTFKRNNTYYLMYSANCYCNKKYSVGYATSNSPKGPFVKCADNPILNYTPQPEAVSGPGHHSVVMSPDDEEIIIIYHSHMDIVAGGGERMINIDRMGFRDDGSIYVNGPTITPQLYPSSKTEKYVSIEQNATISSTYTKSGYKTSYLKDGAFSLYYHLSRYEWVSDYSGDEVSIDFKWNEKQRIREIWLYNSIKDNRKAAKARFVFGDDSEVENIVMKNIPGEATIIHLDNIVKTDSFRLYLKTGSSYNEIAISEVRIFSDEVPLTN
jgi:GH43 family beta-xylosidase